MRELALSGVSVRFGPVQALRDVGLRVGSGEVVMLAGPNGAGKSTLLRVLLGLVRPDRGALLVDGQVRQVDNAFKRQLSYLPEAVAFSDNLSGYRVLRFHAAARGVPRPRIDEVLRQVGLYDARKRAVRGYSRGMRQRLGLGIALLAEPPLLVLDEPTGGLDQEGLTVLWSVLATWRAAGRMVLLSSHDLTLLERRVDRICVLRDGRVLADASPDRLRALADLPVRVTFSLNGNPTQVDGLTEALGRWGRARSMTRGADAMALEVSPAELVPLMDLRAAFPEACGRMRVEEPGLDEVYEHLLCGDLPSSPAGEG